MNNELLKHRLQIILGSGQPVIFFVGIIMLTLISDGISDYVNTFFSDDVAPTALPKLFLGVCGLLLLVIVFNLPKRLRDSLKRTSKIDTTLEVKQFVPRRQGLIVCTSWGRYIVARNAINHHLNDSVVYGDKLTHCYVITGPGEGELSPASNTEQIKQEYESQGVTVERWDVEDADDIRAIYNVMRHIVRNAVARDKLSPTSIIADYTGGTSSMTAGMVLAASIDGIDLQFMKPNTYKADGSADRSAGSSPRIVDINLINSDLGASS